MKAKGNLTIGILLILTGILEIIHPINHLLPHWIWLILLFSIGFGNIYFFYHMNKTKNNNGGKEK